jgi:hypothetical protein
MVERLRDMPPGTIGFRVTGDVTREDYEQVLVPDLHAAIEAQGGVRALYVLEDLDRMEPGALWADSRLGFDLTIRHHSAFERSAVVTDIEWMAHATRLFGWMIPGEARVYPLAEVDAAKAWVAGTAG